MEIEKQAIWEGKEEKNEKESKWEGKACAKLTGLKADQVWPLLADFFNLHKWIQSIETCHQVEGVAGEPGCVRYCATTVVSPDGNSKEIKWAKEKLITIDPIQYCLSYEVTDSNMGFKSYVGTQKVLPIEEEDGCKIEWSFTMEPIEGWSLESFTSYIDSALQPMAKRMQEALQSCN